MKKRLIIIDGNSLMHRAFYALPPMKSSTGISTNIIYGYGTMLQKIKDDYRPDYLIVTFDTKVPTFRHLQYEEYKAGRMKMSEEMAEQIPYLKRMITALDYEILELDGFEADDIIGTIALDGDHKGLETLVITGDRDALQLISDNVNILITKKGISEIDRFDKARLMEVYGLRPEQIIDLKGLMGDASDNIPGVPGVGEKTALELLGTYNSVEKLYECLDEIKKPKLKEKLENNKELAFLSKSLATINREVEISMNYEDFNGQNPNYDALEDIYEELSMKGFLVKLKKQREEMGNVRTSEKKKKGNRPEESENGKTEDADDLDWVKQAESQISNPVKKADLSLLLINPDIRMDVAKNIKSGKISEEEQEQFSFFDIGFDGGSDSGSKAGKNSCESNSSCYGAEEIGTQEELEEIFSKHDSEARIPCKIIETNTKHFLVFYLDGMHSISLEDNLASAKFILENKSIRKIGLDFKSDIVAAGRHGIVATGYAFDVILGGYLVNPLKNFMKLEYLAEEFLEDSDISMELSWNEKIIKLLPELIRLADAIEARLKKEGMDELYYGLEMPLSYILADMELTGFKVDINVLQEIGKELSEKLEILTKDIYEMSGEEFNINSPKQLGEVLFVKLSLPAVKKTKTGFSTDNEVLEDLKDKHEIIEKIIKYRQLIKLKGTYIDGLIPLIGKESGRIHSRLNQVVAATGRLSSTDPNLQNIPVKTVEGREIRKAFVTENENFRLVIADYSQIELRILAHIAEDESLINAFKAKEDIHTHTAAEVFGIKDEEVTKTQRSRAKAVNFGIVYGISDFGLAKDIGVSRKEAKAYIETYFDRYPGVKRYMDNIVDFAKANGYVTTIMGRKRYIPEINSRNAIQRGFGARVAMNTPIQGSAADIIKKAMIDVYRNLEKRGLKAKMIMQVHDELIIEAPVEEVEEVKLLLKQAMEETIKLSVEITADVNDGRNWFESK